MTTQISAGIIIFRRAELGVKFLLLYHSNNYWNFPKGKIEENERSLETAFREVEEETGLKSKDLKLIRNFKASERFTFKDRVSQDKVFKIVTFYLAETRKKDVKIDGRDEGYGWFKLSEAKAVLGKHKNTFEILKKAARMISYYHRRPYPAHPYQNNHPRPFIKKPYSSHLRPEQKSPTPSPAILPDKKI